jgi:hypothetical protein
MHPVPPNAHRCDILGICFRVAMPPRIAESPNHNTPIAAMAQVGIALAYDEIELPGISQNGIGACGGARLGDAPGCLVVLLSSAALLLLT